MPAIAGLRGTGDFATDERPKNFRETILRRNPAGSAPIFALMARVGKDSTNDPEFNWWDEPNDIVRLEVNGTLAAGDTTVVVDSSDPDATNPERVWGTATNLVPGDVLQVEPADSSSEVAGYTNELILVTSVISATQFTVQRGFAGTTAAAITNNEFLLKIGTAYGEGTPSPKTASRNPTKYTNYTQIYKTAYELTGTALSTNFRTGDPLKNDKLRKMFDHSQAIEQSILWGKKNEATDANGKPLRTTGGLREFITSNTTTIFGAAVTAASFLDAVYKVFDYDTMAGDQRAMFCGNGALNELNKVIKADAATTMEMGPVIKVFGMDFREFRLPQGTLFIRTHPLMNRHAIYSKSAFLVDFSALRWRPLRGRDTKFQDNIQNPDEDTRKGQWITEAGLEVRFGGLTCGYLGNISA